MNARLLMKRGLVAPLLLLLALFSLTACEIPAQRTEPINVDATTGIQPPLTDPSLQPAVDPEVQQPAGTDGYPAPGVEGSTGVTTTVTTAPEGGEGSAAEQPAVEQPVEIAPDGVYVVQAGDTLGQIAQRFGVSVEDIAAANNLVNVDDLDIGQELQIPEAGFAETVVEAAPPGDSTGERIHVVQRGDNLYRIGLLYGFTIEELAAYNGLANPNALDVGQEIKIPPSE